MKVKTSRSNGSGKFSDDVTGIRSKRIYVVEDSEITGEMMIKVLNSVPGIKAMVFPNGELLLNQLSKHVPDLIFVDYYIFDGKAEKMNGEKILRRIKSRYPSLPVILVTGMRNPNMISEMKRAGFDDVLLKDEENVISNIVHCVEKYLY